MENNVPKAISADEAAFRLPPPTYEEIMGAYQTSVKQTQPQHSGPQIPPLAYIDIMPRCLSSGNIPGKVVPKFGDFSTILDGANRWLEDNPGLAIWKCESVKKRLNINKDGTLSYELNEMLRHDSTFGFAVYIKGVRLWLTKDATPGGRPQQLGLRNIVPEIMTIEMPTSYRYGYRAGKVTVAGEEYRLTSGYNEFDSFEGLGNTIKRLEKKLADDPIPGTILTVETDKVKAYQQFKKDFNPDGTCWSEDKDQFRRYTQIIRIFYIKGPSAGEQIGYEEFVPELTEAADMLKPGKFEPFHNLMHRLSSWVSANQGVRIVNIQQYEARINKCLSEVNVCSDSTDDVISTFQDQRYARTLRLFYTKSSAVKCLPANCVSCRLFLPARTGPRTFECMTQTVERIGAWLQVTGLPIYSVETVELLFNEYNPMGAEYEKCDYAIPQMSGKRWLTAIRVYFSMPYSEPAPYLLPPAPVYLSGGGGGSGSCTIL